MANAGNGDNDTDPLLQHLISPRINPPLTLLPSREDNDVDVAIPMPMTPSELKDLLIFGPSPPSVLVQNTSPSSSDYSTVKPKSTHHEFNRSRSAPAMAAIDNVTHPVDHVFPRSISNSKYFVMSVALLIVYLSVMSVATVVYGDRALKTLPGWLIASIWLLVSTLAVAQALFRFTEARGIEELANIVLGENMSISEFFFADINQNGYISKSDYAIYKLMKMGKITHLDLIRINNQFDKLDRTNRGKITLSDLLETSTNDVSTATSSLRTHVTT